jgi:hypothetical protein
MKSILITLFSLIISIQSFCNSYPAYHIVNGDTVGIIITIKQAQKIDNDLELLQLFKASKINCDSTLKTYLIIVDEYDKQILTLENKINVLTTIKDTQNSMINNLNLRINNYKEDLVLADKQLSISDKIIKNDEKIIKKLKFKNYLTIGGGILGTTLGLLLGLMISK